MWQGCTTFPSACLQPPRVAHAVAMLRATGVLFSKFAIISVRPWQIMRRRRPRWRPRSPFWRAKRIFWQNAKKICQRPRPSRNRKGWQPPIIESLPCPWLCLRRGRRRPSNRANHLWQRKIPPATRFWSGCFQHKPIVQSLTYLYLSRHHKADYTVVSCLKLWSEQQCQDTFELHCSAIQQHRRKERRSRVQPPAAPFSSIQDKLPPNYRSSWQ